MRRAAPGFFGNIRNSTLLRWSGSLYADRSSHGQYTTLMRLTPPSSYRWRVISDGKTLASGEAATDLDARLAADEAIKGLEQSN